MNYLPFVEQLIKSVVSEPDRVTIEEETQGSVRTFYIHASPDDVGKVIGKHGRVVSNIRCVVSAVASKYHEKAYVKIVTD